MAQQLLAFLHLFRIEWLYFIVGAVIFGLTYVIRRFFPALWVMVTGKYPALALLPMIVIGALLTAAPKSGEGVFAVVQDALIKAVLGTLTALGLHGALKASPLPYNGAEKQVGAAFVRRNTPPGGASALDRPPDTSSAVTPLDRPPSGPSAKT